MEAPASTTLVVVGDEATSAIHALEGFANVRAATFDAASDDEVARWSAAAAAPYVVHDRDPLGHVAAAWVEFFDDQSTYGVLASESPTRVIPWPDADASLAGLLRHLPTGRAWPDVESWLPTVAGAVPDRIGLGG
jgi:hypothetical protein